MGIKDVRVNIIRLTKEQIHSMLNTPPETNTINLNFSLKLNGNKWECTSHPQSIAPKISKGNKISISLRKVNASVVVKAVDVNQTKNKYSLRSRPPTEKIVLKIPKKTSMTTVSELGTNVQKNKLWHACKKKNR